MATHQATARATLGSLLKSVSSTANMITGIVDGVSKTGDLFSNFMSGTLEKQETDQLIELSNYKVQALEAAYINLAESRKATSDFINASESNKVMYATAQADLDTAIKARLIATGKAQADK